MSKDNLESLETVKVSINKMIDKANSDSEFGKFKYYVNTKWEGGTLCNNQIRRAHKLLVDEPASFGGEDLSASPVELVLVALGSCQQMMYSALASIRNVPLEECEVTLKANLDVRGLLGLDDEKKTFPGFSSISYETNLVSSADEDTLDKLIEDVENQCPVMDMLTRNMKIDGVVKVSKGDDGND